MAGVAPAELLSLVARFAFLVLLYCFVGAVLLSLRRTIWSAGTPPAGRSRGSLVLQDGSPVDGPIGRMVALDRPLLFGRRPDCDVVLRDDSVSGHHARIVWIDGGWRIEDLESTNGTFVNARRTRDATSLESGDVVQIGTATWRVDLPST